MRGYTLGGDELLSAIDVVSCAGKGGIHHDVYGERSYIGGFHHTPDRKRGAQLIAAIFNLVPEKLLR